MPDVLVLVFDVSGCSASEVLVPEVLVPEVLVPEVLVRDDSEVLDFDDSDVLDFEVPLTPYLPSYFLPSATPESTTAIGIIAITAAAALTRPVRFQFTKNTTPQEFVR